MKIVFRITLVAFLLWTLLTWLIFGMEYYVWSFGAPGSRGQLRWPT
jgi:hypothetical protein